MSKVQVDTIDTRSGTSTMQIGSTNTSTINIGVSGDTVNIPAGVTIANAGTATGFGSNTPYFHVNRNGSNQSSIADNTPTVVQWTTEVFDTGNYFDNSSNYTWTPSAGTYFVYAQVRFQRNGVDDLSCIIQKNGSALFSMNNHGSYYTGAFTSGLVSMNGSDTLRVLGVQYSGSNQDLSGGTDQSWFGGYKVS